ncbi:MAG: peptidylprolyl isomerase [Ruminococcus sp.]|nr:peptidylprolyl isomerase [Ruminococcus sp.]
MKIKIKKTLFPALLIAVSLVFGGCEGDSTVERAEDGTTTAPASAVITTEDAVIHNFEPPVAGEKIIEMKIKDYGTIKIKLFPEVAALASENFIGLTESGYYDGLFFHRVIENFMNQGGDPRGDGTGGQSMWGGQFDGGVPEGMYHFSGAVAYANSGSTSTDGSQFYIVNTAEGYNYCGGYTDANGETVVVTDIEASGLTMPANVLEKYKEVGGVPMLDGNYTVFGQVIEGLDIVRQIGSVETNADDKPLVQVTMEDVNVVEYQG